MSNEQMKSDSIGVVRISSEVIAIVSSVAVSEVKGVIGLYDETKTGLFGFKGANKGVRAEIKDNIVNIEIDIVVEYGANIPEIAWEIQGKVKKAVESMTGLIAQKVNVNIKGIEFKQDEEIVE